MVLFALATMVGCQGFSASKSATVQPASSTGTLGANPPSLNFGTVQTGTNLPLSQTVTNSGNSSVTISQVGISGTSFPLSGINPAVTLAAGQGASFTVTFAPTSATSASGSVTAISLAGAGSATAGVLSATPAPVGVGSVALGASGTGSGTLSASGANVTITTATANNSRFTIGGLSRYCSLNRSNRPRL
jgi:hypothetical protein